MTLEGVLAGLRVDADDEDDPVLLRPDGTIVDTWHEDYPYDGRMSRAEHDRTSSACSSGRRSPS